MEIQQIFLSYSRPDQDQVEQIAVRLDREGYKVWYDQARIVPGESWSDALNHGLRESSHCLVFVGPGEVRPWQREEIRTAINRAVSEVKDFRLIPVLLPGVKVRPGESEIPSFLTNRQWVEFRESIDNEDNWRRLIRGLQGKEPGFDLPAGHAGECPYKGLGVFGIEDAPYFYGREAVTGTLLTRLRERITQPGRPRFFAIIGPSGTGKSSLVRAGVLAGIVERGVLDDCGKWIRSPLIFKPGDEPITALAKKLIAHEDTGQRFKAWSVAELEAKMRETVNGEFRFLGDEIEAVLPEGAYLPVLVDQFEEMLRPLTLRDTPNNDKQEQIEAYMRSQFLPFVQNLAFAARQERGRLVFIVTMRDDFYGICGSDPVLRALVSENHHLLAPMSTTELVDAVERPARQSGKAVQPALLTLIERDMSNRPGALPLLQETLEQLWHRSGNTLTSDTYTELGGITGSLGKKADASYNRLIKESNQTPEARRHREDLIRRIFLDLVNRGSGIASSRRRERSELPDDPDTGHVLEVFVDAHLLLESGDKDTSQSYYELTHEALIEHWSKLHDWLNSEEEDDRYRQQLEEEANRWFNEREQHKEQPDDWQQLEPEYLLKGNRWHKIEQWLNHSDIPVSERAHHFVDRCRSHSDQQRRVRRNKWILAAMLLISVLSGGVISYFYLTHTHLDLSVHNANGEAIDDFAFYVSKDRSTRDTSRMRWFNPGLLEPDQPYWFRIESNGYITWKRKIPTAHAGEPTQIEVKLSYFREPEMVRIKGDSFEMGSDPEMYSNAADDEEPRHKVTIEAFYMGKYEVTFDEYDAFANNANRKLPDDKGWDRGKQPVINVSWEDAVAYTEWLSKKTGKRYRLPTEAEWEYVARTGTDTEYWWGDDIRQDGEELRWRWLCQWDGKQTAPVGSFQPNAFKLYDTAGNVWEWVQDCWHDSYEGAPDDGSAWEAAGAGHCDRRVLRGGSWDSRPRVLRSAYRLRGSPGYRADNLGFRLAQDVE